MIDLTKKDLPNAIMVNGKSILLNTDFRLWIEIWHELEEKKRIALKDVILDKKIKLTEEEMKEFEQKFIDFLYNPSITPNYPRSKSEKTIDYYYDGSYIYSAFYKAYGIDLLKEDMHWHKFKALVDDLDVGIISFAKKARAYKKPSKTDTQEKVMEKEKKAWTFPTVQTKEQEEERKEKIAKFDELFKNTYYKGGGK